MLILVLDVENPELKTLLFFLNRVGSRALANFTALCEGGLEGVRDNEPVPQILP